MTVESIILNGAGDVLVSGLSDEATFFGEPGFRTVKLGEHETRGDSVYLFELRNSNVIVCKDVALRIEISKEINTLGKLRKWCADEIQRKSMEQSVVCNIIAERRRL